MINNFGCDLPGVVVYYTWGFRAKATGCMQRDGAPSLPPSHPPNHPPVAVHEFSSVFVHRFFVCSTLVYASEFDRWDVGITAAGGTTRRDDRGTVIILTGGGGGKNIPATLNRHGYGYPGNVLPSFWDSFWDMTSRRRCEFSKLFLLFLVFYQGGKNFLEIFYPF